jgi:hypothetical protein
MPKQALICGQQSSQAESRRSESGRPLSLSLSNLFIHHLIFNSPLKTM